MVEIRIDRARSVGGRFIFRRARAPAAEDSATLKGKADHVARILMVTQSAGFKHSSVTRKNRRPLDRRANGHRAWSFPAACSTSIARRTWPRISRRRSWPTTTSCSSTPPAICRSRKRRTRLFLQRLAQAKGARLHRHPFGHRHLSQLQAVLGHDRRRRSTAIPGATARK